jgi:hypothetical protein
MEAGADAHAIDPREFVYERVGARFEMDVIVVWGTPGLLTAYEQERRAVALRNREAAGRHALVRGAIMTANWTAMHSERWLGERARRRLGREISDLGNLENEAMGIELGYRYGTLPAVCHERGGVRGSGRAHRRCSAHHVSTRCSLLESERPVICSKRSSR